MGSNTGTRAASYEEKFSIDGAIKCPSMYLDKWAPWSRLMRNLLLAGWWADLACCLPSKHDSQVPLRDALSY